MKKKIILIVSSALLIIWGALTFSKSAPKERPEVLVTLAPYKTFAERLTDHQVKVHTITSANEDPHIYSPSPKEFITFFNAKVWFITGEPFEEKLIPVLKKNNPDLKIVDLREKIDLIHGSCCHGHSDQDLHFWMSPTVAQNQANFMAETLKEIYPEKAELIEQQHHNLEVDFQNLKAKLKEDLSSKHGMTLLVSHPAFSYFAQEFHVHQVSVEDGSGDPSPKRLAHLLSLIDEKHIHTIFTQPQHPDQAMEQIAMTKHLKKQEMNPYSENYFENLSQFGEHLKGN